MAQSIKPPILLLFFNRLDTTIKVFAEIRKYRPDKLFLASDGPRENVAGESEKVSLVRDEIIKLIDWPCEIHQKFNERNLGCKEAVSSAIDWFFENVESGIILEDDCLAHPDFFTFCASMLEKYKNDSRISLIAGTNFFAHRIQYQNYFYARYFAIWGWATWKDRWHQNQYHIEAFDHIFTSGTYKNIFNNFYVGLKMKEYYEICKKNIVNTWDIPWAYSCLFNNSLSIVPKENLITNIGLDGTHYTTDQHTEGNLLLPLYQGRYENYVAPKFMLPDDQYPKMVYLKDTNYIKATIKFILKKFRVIK